MDYEHKKMTTALPLVAFSTGAFYQHAVKEIFLNSFFVVYFVSACPRFVGVCFILLPRNGDQIYRYTTRQLLIHPPRSPSVRNLSRANLPS